MSVEIIRCHWCRKEFDADSNDLGTYQCPHCKTKFHGKNPPPSWQTKKPLDRAFEQMMPFGKWKGTPFYKIPDQYLEWLELELVTNKEGKKQNAELLEKITAELKRRKDNPRARV